MALLALSGVPEKDPGPKFFLGLWFIQGLGADLVFGAIARHKLLNEFRLAAQERYATRTGFWKRWVGGAGEGQTPNRPVGTADSRVLDL
jgi:hypothetical protein